MEGEQRLSLEERSIVHDYLKRCVEDGPEIEGGLKGADYEKDPPEAKAGHP